jgi:ribosomal-protein-alanine N-acetyltransferase
MKKSNFPEIQTQRLLLRRLLPSDWESVSFLRSDIKVNEFVKRPPAESKEKALSFINKISTGINNQNLYYWAISENNNDEMIGSICLWNFSTDNKIAEVGYDLKPKHQGKGIMAESLKSIIAFGFNKLKIDTIEAFTHKHNISSKKLLERNGFTLAIGKQDEHNANNIVYEIKNIPT